MTTSKTSRDELVADITAAVTAAVRAEITSCMCPLSQEDRTEIPLLYDVYKDLGDGNLANGIRRSRNLFKFVSDVYNRKNMVTGAVLVTVILGAFGMLGTWIWSGFVSMMRGQ